MPNRASKTLLEHAGGQPTLQRLVDVFYTSVLADPLLQPLFGTGRPGHVDHLTAFTAETFGGPLAFTDRLGFAHLIDIHPPEIAMLIPALRLQVSAPPTAHHERRFSVNAGRPPVQRPRRRTDHCRSSPMDER